MLYDNICKLCKERHISVAKLEREIGLGNATIRGWKKYSPTIVSLKKVADFFNVTIDFLLTNSPTGTESEKKYI